MKTNLIKKYGEWINEAAESVTPAKPATDTPNGVTFISASSSASNVAPALAQKMGVEANKLYTIQLKSIGQLAVIYNDGRFGGDKAKASGIGFDPATATATKPGEDILEINGKRITETGSIIFAKAELAGKPVTIKASGNGLLNLLRMGEALQVMYTTHKNSLMMSKDYAMRFAIGGNVAEKDSRGFSYWFAKPGQLEADSNLIAMVVAMALLKASGNENRISKKDPVVSGWYEAMIKGRDAKASLTEIAKLTSTRLASRMMLTQNPPADVTGAWTITDTKPLMRIANEVAKIKLTEAGNAALKAIMPAMAAAIAPIAPPPGFGAESQGVLNVYAQMIKSELEAKLPGYWFMSCQEESQWSPDEQTPGASGTAKADQKEGQFGPTGQK